MIDMITRLNHSYEKTDHIYGVYDKDKKLLFIFTVTFKEWSQRLRSGEVPSKFLFQLARKQYNE